MSVLVEACCGSAEDAIEAYKGGADRVELCSAMSLGGITPTVGMVDAIKAKCDIPIMAMLRPRTGGFCYTDTEFETMKQDAKALISAGVEGLVFGILHEDGTIDAQRCKEMMRLVSVESLGLPKRVVTVFHRAFDVVPNWETAMEQLIEITFDRILTSGQQSKAIDAVQTISKMVKVADGRIEILAGGGVRVDNAKELISKTGVNQIHLRGVKWIDEKSCNNGPNKIMFNGKPDPEDAYSISDSSYFANLVQQIR